ncbi:MAG: hypothetical protein O7G85_10295 [Planctomycetota bacterium]|nr:hypothetical protein [Planctomycetota bacterium]
METFAHRQLKKLALAFLRKLGCMVFAEEVRCPISRYRVDAAGYLDRQPSRAIRKAWANAPSLESLYETHGDAKRWWRCQPRTILIECKQSRADFLRDNRHLDSLLKRRTALQGIRGSIEERQIKRLEPQLRRSGTTLFPEMDDWDFNGSRLASYRDTMRKLRHTEAQLYGQTKFHMIARYRLADRLFIAAPKGMLRPGELPLGWGLLECPPQCLQQENEEDSLFDEPPRLSIRHDAVEFTAPEPLRLRLLRNIAAAASFSSLVLNRAVQDHADSH